jgi:hypothetical protein
MTTGWQPGGEPPTVPPPAAPQSGYYTPPPQSGYGYNWGLAYPAPGYQAVYLVPRPPRPGVVNLAVLLTILGVLISGAQFAINLVTTYINKNELVTGLGEANGAQPQQLVNTAFQVGLIVSVVVWLLPAAGALVTALLARRGSNAARIVLACLMGLFALNGLCGGIFGLVNPRMSGLTAIRESGLSPVFDLVLTGLAVAIGVLVLVPSANRFFSAGPGRRFMTST